MTYSMAEAALVQIFCLLQANGRTGWNVGDDELNIHVVPHVVPHVQMNLFIMTTNSLLHSYCSRFLKIYYVNKVTNNYYHHKV